MVGFVVEACMAGWFNLGLVLLAIICLGLVGIWQLGYDPIAHLSCLKLEDSYVSVVNTGKKIGRYYCVHTYTDGGKSCSSSSESEGDCMVTEQTKIESDGYYGKKVVGSGRCQDVLRVQWKILRYFASNRYVSPNSFLTQGIWINSQLRPKDSARQATDLSTKYSSKLPGYASSAMPKRLSSTLRTTTWSR